MNSKIVDKRISRTEKAFKAALVSACMKKDIASVSVSDLVEESGYSRSAFYARFASKDTFLKKLADDEIELYTMLSIASMEVLETGKITEESVLKFFMHIYENKDLYKLIFQTGKSESPLSEEYFFENVLLKVEQTITAHKLDLNLDLELFTFVTLNKYFSYIKFWIKHDFNYSPEYMAKQIKYTSREPRCVSFS